MNERHDEARREIFGKAVKVMENFRAIRNSTWRGGISANIITLFNHIGICSSHIFPLYTIRNGCIQSFILHSYYGTCEFTERFL